MVLTYDTVCGGKGHDPHLRDTLWGRHPYNSVRYPLLRSEFIRLLERRPTRKPMGPLHWSREDHLGWMHDHFADSVLLAGEESETETSERELLTTEGLKVKGRTKEEASK